MIWSLPQRIDSSILDSLPVPVSTLDFVPTVLDLAGLPQDALFTRGRIKADLQLPGKSLLPWLTGIPVPADRAVCVEFANNMHLGSPIRMRAMVSGRWKLAVFASEPTGLLYDLDNDPHELHNLWKESGVQAVKGEIVCELLRRQIDSDRMSLPRHIGA
jgi:arylsulfatase A-like enzyme